MESQLLYLIMDLEGLYDNKDGKNITICIDDIAICIYPRRIVIFVITGGLQMPGKSD